LPEKRKQGKQNARKKLKSLIPLKGS